MDDDYRVLASFCGAGHCQRESIDTATGHRHRVDAVAAVAGNRYHQFLGVVTLRLHVGHRQAQLHLGELAVCRGQHQEDQHDKQNVDERDQVDLGLLAYVSAKVHGCARSELRWRTSRSEASSSVSR